MEDDLLMFERKTMKPLFSALLTVLLVLIPVARVQAEPFTAPPVATSFSTAIPANRQAVLQLLGSDPDGTALTFATVATPSHGTLSLLNTATGYVVYTPTANYVGPDSFTFTVTS